MLSLMGCPRLFKHGSITIPALVVPFRCAGSKHTKLKKLALGSGYWDARMSTLLAESLEIALLQENSQRIEEEISISLQALPSQSLESSHVGATRDSELLAGDPPAESCGVVLCREFPSSDPPSSS